MKIWYFPLEVIDARMYRQIDTKMIEAFEQFDVEFEAVVPVTKAEEIKEGGWVMPTAGHCLFCLQQMSMFMEHLRQGDVKDGDILYFNDLWFPGLESVFYARHLMKIRLNVYGFIHAGSFTYADFVYPMAHWARDLERSWFTQSSAIYVGSGQTKKDICTCSLIDDPDKVVVTGLPFAVERPLLSTVRENIIVWPHRDDPDKRVEDLVALLLLLKRYQLDFTVVITGGGRSVRKSTFGLLSQFSNVEFQPNLSKLDYYKLLGRSKVLFSSAVQENFGVAVQESLAHGVFPVCPNRVSYSYLLPEKFLYDNLKQAAGMIFGFMNDGVGADNRKYGVTPLNQLCHHPYAGDLIVHDMLAKEGL